MASKNQGPRGQQGNGQQGRRGRGRGQAPRA